jgi:hypothetical protein
MTLDVLVQKVDTVQRVDLTYNGRQLQQYSDGPNTPPTIERKP